MKRFNQPMIMLSELIMFSVKQAAFGRLSYLVQGGSLTFPTKTMHNSKNIPQHYHTFAICLIPSKCLFVEWFLVNPRILFFKFFFVYGGRAPSPRTLSSMRPRVWWPKGRWKKMKVMKIMMINLTRFHAFGDHFKLKENCAQISFVYSPVYRLLCIFIYT